MPTIQYTLRNIPPDIDAYLRREARRQKVSLNTLTLDYLQAATKDYRKIDERLKPVQAKGKHWLDGFTDSGTVDVHTQKILADQEILDKQRMLRGD